MSEINTGKVTEITMPKLGESITEATILHWLVKPGDVVEKGQAILEVATDKVDSEVPAPVRGKILELSTAADEVVKIGQVLGRMQASDEAITETSKSKSDKAAAAPDPMPVSKTPTKSAAPKKKASPSVVSGGQSYTIPGRNDNSFFSPLVREIAKDYHISYEELARIPASGKDGRIRKSDIFKYLEEGRPAQFVQTMPAPEPTGFQIPDLKFDFGKGKMVEMNRMGRMIADHMVFSKINSPHVTAYVEADMTNMVTWRDQNKVEFQKKYDERLTFTPLFIQAITKAIQDFPMINSTFDGRNIIVKEDINIGMAAALPDGNLIVPVVKNTGTKDLLTLAKEVNELAVKARENRLNTDDISGSTFTISNVGTFGSLMGTPIINQPEAAILATGIIKKRPEVIEYPDGDKIEIRQMMYLCLSFDHRFVGGHLAGSFLRRIADYFEGFDTKMKI